MPSSSAEALPPPRLSLTGREWVMPDPGVERAALAISQRHAVPELVGRVLATRGVPLDEAGAHLAPTLRDAMPDPSALADMDAAAERLAAAVRKGERVALFGDYDVDGAASTALMTRWLRAQGVEPVVHIPDRMTEGYGPNDAAMRRLGEAADLVICLDCGTAAPGPLAVATKAGADVMVVDHHLAAGDLPDVLAVVNPNRPDDASGQGALCAAGVAFLLLVAANRALRAAGAEEPKLLPLLDLVALATVADVAPLTGLNRAFVLQGLKVMANRRNPGLRALGDVARLEAAPSAFHCGYVLGPRINAAGRVGRSDMGARLLSTDDAQEAQGIAAVLEDDNRARRAIEAEVQAEAIAQVEARGEAGPLVWAAGQGWHPGVVGIVAGRLRERYHRPALVVALEGATGRGSARGVAGLDLGGAIQRAAEHGLLLKGGGHRMAAGLTVAADGVEAAVAAIADDLARQGAGEGGPEPLPLTGALHPGGATLDLCGWLERAGPYGAGAPAPIFAFEGVRIEGARQAGENHLAFRLSAQGARLDAIAFRAFDGEIGRALMGAPGVVADVAGRLEADEWRGRRRVKLMVEDVRLP